MSKQLEKCKECGDRHNPERPHCPVCGEAMVREQKAGIPGWGCGKWSGSGCYYRRMVVGGPSTWISDNPSRQE